jgi:hypothetical protein
MLTAASEDLVQEPHGELRPESELAPAGHSVRRLGVIDHALLNEISGIVPAHTFDGFGIRPLVR